MLLFNSVSFCFQLLSTLCHHKFVHDDIIADIPKVSEEKLMSVELTCAATKISSLGSIFICLLREK